MKKLYKITVSVLLVSLICPFGLTGLCLLGKMSKGHRQKPALQGP